MAEKGKTLLMKKKGNVSADNDETAIFFTKDELRQLKKLGIGFQILFMFMD
jgi:hypothetical protein